MYANIIVLILIILFTIELKLSPRLHWYRCKKYINIYIYYTVKSNYDYVSRENIHLKFKIK